MPRVTTSVARGIEALPRRFRLATRLRPWPVAPAPQYTDRQMRRHRFIQVLAVGLPLVVTTALWLLAKQRLGTDDLDLARALSQILSLLSLTLMAEVMLIAARNRTVERVYGGLDKSYRLHGTLAKWSILLILAHPFLLMPSLARRGIPWTSALVPFGPWPEGFELARWMGVLAYYGLTGLTLLTLFRRIDYNHWLFSHRFMLVLYGCAFAHTFLANSDVRAFEPLRDWVLWFGGLGLLAGIYKVAFYRWAAQQYRYRVSRVEPLANGILDLGLRPVGSRMAYEPGEFAFLSVRGNPGISPEPHPFSIASGPHKHELRFGIRPAGDYTKTLSQLRVGDEVQVYGPYGEFTSYQLDEFKRQVWVGAGIGITPFLSMGSYETVNEDDKSITWFYAGKDRNDLVYLAEAEDYAQRYGDKLRLIPFPADTEGFLTADRILTESPDTPETAYLFCGPPPMMKALKSQLIAKGVAPQRIFFEDFSFV